MEFALARDHAIAYPKAMAQATELLKSVFGFDAFRPGQEEIIEAVCAGEDVLAILPTGGGKSLCFQLPALVRDGLTVVISPLIALMRDQVRALREAGVAAAALTSQSDDMEVDEIFAGVEDGSLSLLYMAPERLGRAEGWLSRARVSLIAVDEAHCVSQWGHDFRPDYLRIGPLRRALGVPLAAFTATADPETQTEIGARLFEAPPRLFLRGFDRPNLDLAFAPKNSPRRQLLDFATARRGQSGIVYCGSRNKTEVLSQALNAAGISALHYHAGMDGEARQTAESRFQREDGLVVCATVAFGMGIDKPDIRYVAHADLPKSIEAYYQEIGRAGRDGAPAETLTLFGADDIRLRRAQIDEGLAEGERKGADHGRLNALLGLAEAVDCRRTVLLRYFGETHAGGCDACDNCRTPPQTFDATVPAQKLLSAAIRTGEWFGSGHLIDVLRGEKTDKVAARAHDALPTFGCGTDLSRTDWQSVARQMMGHDLLRPNAERHGALTLTEAARPVLRGEVSLVFRKATAVPAAQRRTQPKALISEENEALLSALKAKRRELAEARRAPAYVIFPDRTLIEMAEQKPQDLDAMRQIPGVGTKKLETYGQIFLSVITGEDASQHPARRRIAGQQSSAQYDALEAEMIRLARGESGLEPFMSCTKGTLVKIAGSAPQDLTALEAVPGMGPKKAARFGAAFLAILTGK